MSEQRNSVEFPNLTPLLSEWEWQQEGNCAKQGVDVEVFFLPSGARASEKAHRERVAKQICNDCPVKLRCLEHALVVPERYGVWGGTTPEERTAVLNKVITIEELINE